MKNTDKFELYLSKEIIAFKKSWAKGMKKSLETKPDSLDVDFEL